MTIDVDDHGGVFRCLLRVRENAGNAVMSDREFLDRYAGIDETADSGDANTSSWSLNVLKKAAAALSLKFDFQTSTSYEEVLSEHRAGYAVLVRVEGSQIGLRSDVENDFRVTVLADKDELEMSLWCPLRNGLWELLPSVSRNRWEQIEALGVTLLTPAHSSA